jgi:hypothetical protein
MHDYILLEYCGIKCSMYSEPKIIASIMMCKANSIRRKYVDLFYHSVDIDTLKRCLSVLKFAILISNIFETY